jgi:cation:H+ antiporter
VEPLALAGFLAGPFVLVAGAEMLVRGAGRLAAAFGLSPLLIGMTVVSYGTGAPEMAVSFNAAAAGRGDIALGNVVGSNIANILLVLGLAATITPLPIPRRVVQRDVPLMIGTSVLVFGLAIDGSLSRLDGLLMCAGILGYTYSAFRHERRFPRANGDAPDRPLALEIVGRQLILIAAGLVALATAGGWIVEGATAIARSFGVSELVIGVTIVAIGTSLPEVATSVVAGLRGQSEIAVGNVVGVNVFNLLAVLGATTVAIPGGLLIPPRALSIDFPVMLAAALVCLPLFQTRQRLDRVEGLFLLACLVAYLAYRWTEAVG